MLTQLLAPQRRSLQYPSSDLLALLRGTGMASATGVAVDEETALTYAAVLGAVRVLAESLACLPALLYRRDGRSRVRSVEHRVYDLLHSAPNPNMTPFEWFELGMSHVALWGNFYAEIELDRAGRPLALWPLRPDRMQVSAGADDRLVYRYETTRGVIEMDGDLVLHVRGLSKGGVVGYSFIRLAREQIGLGVAAEQFGAALFENGALPGVVVQHPGRLSPDAYKNLKQSWAETHQGLANAHKPAILEEGMTVEQLGIPPEDAQFLQTRRFQVEEIARIFRVPLHMLQDLSHATYANIEHQSLDFSTFTMLPWMTRWEQSLARQLLTPQERQHYYIEFLSDALRRADTKTRYEAYGIGRQWGWLSRNDIRRMENMDYIPDGDDYLTPLNMTPMPADAAGQRNVRDPSALQTTLDHLGMAALVHEQHRQTHAGQMRAATGRRRVMERYRPALRDVMQRILNREANDVLNAARRIFGKRSVVEFDSWLDGFYEEHIQFMAGYLAPVFGAYADLIVGELEEETGGTVRQEDVQAFLDPYTASRARIYGARHKAGVKRVAAEAQANGEDPQAAVEAEMRRLQEEEAEEFAKDESTRLGNALARTLLPLLGVMRLMWLAYGESCDYCQSLNGRIVGSNAWFVLEGESLSDGAGGEYRPGSNVGHPPLHNGCDCMIVPA